MPTVTVGTLPECKMLETPEIVHILSSEEGRKQQTTFFSTPTAPPTALFLAAARLERGLQTVGRGSLVGTAHPEGPNMTHPYPDVLNL